MGGEGQFGAALPTSVRGVGEEERGKNMGARVACGFGTERERGGEQALEETMLTGGPGLSACERGEGGGDGGLGLA